MFSTDHLAARQPPDDSGNAQDDAAGERACDLGEQPMDASQRAEAKQYGRRKLAVELIGAALEVAYLAVMAAFAAEPLDRWLAALGPALAAPWLRLAAFFLLLMGIGQAVAMPLSFYSGYVLEHRHQLSRQTPGRWLRRLALRASLAAALGLALTEGLYWLIWTAGPYWIVAAAAASFLVSVVLGQLAPILLLPLFYRVEPLRDQALQDRFQHLCRGARLKIEGVYRLGLSRETVKANAMLAGLGRTRRVILGDTLLSLLNPDELEVVFAHEVGHHVYRHIGKMMAAGLAYSAVSFWLADGILRWRFAGDDGLLHYAALPIHALPWLMLIITVFSLALSPLRCALSRRFERQCDAYALKHTGRPEAYRRAFQKLARLNKEDPQPSRWEVWLTHDHPPIAERLALAPSRASDQLPAEPADQASHLQNADG